MSPLSPRRWLLAGVLALWAGPASAQAPAPSAAATAAASAPGSMSLADASVRSQRIADELRSPFCPGKTLLTCTSGQAFTARQEIRDRLLAGESEEAIITDFKGRYGDQIVNPPQPWYTVLGPLTPVLVGVLVLAAVTWRWRKSRKEAGPGEPPDGSSGADAERLSRLRRQVSREDD